MGRAERRDQSVEAVAHLPWASACRGVAATVGAEVDAEADRVQSEQRGNQVTAEGFPAIRARGGGLSSTGRLQQRPYSRRGGRRRDDRFQPEQAGGGGAQLARRSCGEQRRVADDQTDAGHFDQGGAGEAVAADRALRQREPGRAGEQQSRLEDTAAVMQGTPGSRLRTSWAGRIRASADAACLESRPGANTSLQPDVHGLVARAVPARRQRPTVDDESGDEDELGAGSDALAGLSDEELEAELTIAAENPGLDARFRALLAERERRGLGSG